MPSYRLRTGVGLSEFANTFVPFGILIVVALMAAEMTQNLTMSRVIYTVWVSLVLFIPAIYLYVLPGTSHQRSTYWLLLWTFSFLAYAVHFYFSLFVFFDGSIAAVFSNQGVMIAAINFLATFWWGIDVVLAWVVGADSRWIKRQRVALNVLLFVMFFVSTMVFDKEGVVRVLGIVLTVAVAIGLLARCLCRKSGVGGSRGFPINL